MNKSEEDFQSKEEYNDYLEEIEVISNAYPVASLVKGERVEEFQAVLQKHSLDHQEQIENSRTKQEELLKHLKAIISDAVYNDTFRN
jgi:hypothetical protein